MFTAASNRLLEGYRQLQYYPEGTRARGGEPKPYSQIKIALLSFAFQNNIPVYPMSLLGTQKIIRDKLIHPGQKVAIHLHAPLHPKNFDSKEEFAQACWQKVVTGFYELKETMN